MRFSIGGEQGERGAREHAAITCSLFDLAKS